MSVGRSTPAPARVEVFCDSPAHKRGKRATIAEFFQDCSACDNFDELGRELCQTRGGARPHELTWNLDIPYGRGSSPSIWPRQILRRPGGSVETRYRLDCRLCKTTAAVRADTLQPILSMVLARGDSHIPLSDIAAMLA